MADDEQEGRQDPYKKTYPSPAPSAPEWSEGKRRKEMARRHSSSPAKGSLVPGVVRRNLAAVGYHSATDSDSDKEERGAGVAKLTTPARSTSVSAPASAVSSGGSARGGKDEPTVESATKLLHACRRKIFQHKDAAGQAWTDHGASNKDFKEQSAIKEVVRLMGLILVAEDDLVKLRKGKKRQLRQRLDDILQWASTDHQRDWIQRCWKLAQDKGHASQAAGRKARERVAGPMESSQQGAPGAGSAARAARASPQDVIAAAREHDGDAPSSSVGACEPDESVPADKTLKRMTLGRLLRLVECIAEAEMLTRLETMYVRDTRTMLDAKVKNKELYFTHLVKLFHDVEFKPALDLSLLTDQGIDASDALSTEAAHWEAEWVVLRKTLMKDWKTMKNARSAACPVYVKSGTNQYEWSDVWSKLTDLHQSDSIQKATFYLARIMEDRQLSSLNKHFYTPIDRDVAVESNLGRKAGGVGAGGGWGGQADGDWGDGNMVGKGGGGKVLPAGDGSSAAPATKGALKRRADGSGGGEASTKRSKHNQSHIAKDAALIQHQGEMLKGAKVKDHKPVASMADTHAAVREAQKAAARFYTTMDKTVAAKATADSRADALKAWKDATSALREAKKNKEPEDNLLALQAMVDDAMADIKEANRQAALLKQAAEGGSADQEGGGRAPEWGQTLAQLRLSRWTWMKKVYTTMRCSTCTAQTHQTRRMMMRTELSVKTYRRAAPAKAQPH